MLNRRSFLQRTLQLSAAFALKTGYVVDGSDTRLEVRPGDGEPVSLAPDFTGLGYEMSSVAQPGLLSPRNSRYVNLVRGLGARGVLRVGGIVANYTRYEANGTAVDGKQNTVITQEGLEHFSKFLAEIGWTAIWSVNFAKGSIEEAISEAKAVHEVLGTRLLALEIGNEVDTYGHGQPFRPPSYDYEAYRKEFAEWHAAIDRAVPGIPFAAPDTAGSYDWVQRMAADAEGSVQLLTTHYYRNGQRNGSAEQLLRPDSRLSQALIGLGRASRDHGIPWRMCETNSFSGGGLPGVSDTLVGALWTLDFMLLLARNGCSGVNIETGVNQLGFVSSYSPIQDDGNGLNSAGAPYYGMLAFAKAVSGCQHVIPIELDNRGLSVTAYALGTRAVPRCAVVINKESNRDIELDLGQLRFKKAVGMRLLSPRGTNSEVTFAGTAVNKDGEWKAGTLEPIDGARLIVPRMSAIVVRST